ncbi:unnamed protein product [Rotaria sp. Silwood2]|nr:unnamed protein product [Rotaria sp. Silwood2]CAF3090159.1 unnamed protein product [Rotaria sp. Silwood2]CAF4055093.1 unnamed protein product [Rotaria sp. Silwood2]CAF4262820.1 unnamed protein product [Rotaria sp. Silwood2]
MYPIANLAIQRRATNDTVVQGIKIEKGEHNPLILGTIKLVLSISTFMKRVPKSAKLYILNFNVAANGVYSPTSPRYPSNDPINIYGSKSPYYNPRRPIYSTTGGRQDSTSPYYSSKSPACSPSSPARARPSYSMPLSFNLKSIIFIFIYLGPRATVRPTFPTYAPQSPASLTISSSMSSPRTIHDDDSNHDGNLMD